MEKLKIPNSRCFDSSKSGDTFVFDIETLGIAERVHEWGKPYPDFVEPKYGNTKDPIKRQALYDTKYKEWQEGEIDWWKKQEDRAALDPLTGRVCAIGYLYPYADDHVDRVIIDGLTTTGVHDLEEKYILERFWEKLTEVSFTFGHVIGHNIEEFDLKFMMKRSFIVGAKVSPTVTNGRFFHRCIVDTMKIWCQYGFNECISLDKLSKILGAGEKPDYEAKQFAHDYLNGNREQAEAYLRNDLYMTHKCYERMYQ